MAAAQGEVMLPHQTLWATARTGRFGVAYVRSVVASAGVGFDETTADEDVLAVDGTFQFDVAPIRVQIKATKTQSFNGNDEIKVQVTDEAWAKWQTAILPEYAVLVVIGEPDEAAWLNQSRPGVTDVPAAAYWTPVSGPDVTQTSGSLTFSQKNRFTVDTVSEIYRSITGGGFGADA